MPKNALLLILILIMGATAIWYSANATAEIWRYSHLNKKTAAKEISWQVEALASDIFVLQASFSFATEGKLHSNTTTFSSGKFRNLWAAEQAIAEYVRRPWQVWYDQDNPTHASLEKKFPWKAILYGMGLWSLCLYFILLDKKSLA